MLGDPVVLARYRAKITTVPGSVCLWWTGAVSGRSTRERTDGGGHGRFWFAQGRVIIAHRSALAVMHGVEVLDDARLLGPRCDNPLCQRSTSWVSMPITDGRRKPQDIDDTALATAVYLCAGSDNLATADGLRSSVYRYNHSESYVDLVSSVTNAYLDGDFMLVLNGGRRGRLPDPRADVRPARSGRFQGLAGPRRRASCRASCLGRGADPLHAAGPQQPAHEPT